jgi:sugar phosphate isomerase/epimerase
MNRQTFLRVTSAGLLGAALFPDELIAGSPAPKAKLSLQLYTVRNAIKEDLDGTLKKIADIGFKYVETAFWPPEISLKKAAAAIKAAGLKVSSCHVELPFGDEQLAFTKTAAAFGCKKLIWHGWPEDKRYSSLQGTRELIGLYNKAAAYAKSFGLEFGLHNHWWEYRNVVGGKPVYEWLLKETDPRIFFEIDTYWVKVAGFTPAEIIQKFGKRARFLHIKDGPAQWNDKLGKDDPDPMTAVGKGTQDMPAIINAARYAEFMVVEMDKTATDVYQAVKESFDYMVKNKFASIE